MNAMLWILLFLVVAAIAIVVLARFYVRGTRETPPYFNPPGHVSLEDTASYVGGRNRFQNPPLTDAEIQRLALFSAAMTTPPNPHRAADGGLKETLDVGKLNRKNKRV